MPFSLSNAPAVFQNLVNYVLRDFLHKFVFIHLDDILIFSKTLDQHKIHVRQVLQRVMENQLYVKDEKCELQVPSITFFGYILEDWQIRADSAKIQAIKECKTPETWKQLQRLIGFANFYRTLICNFSKIAEPLNSLTSTIKSFQWTPGADHAQDTIHPGTHPISTKLYLFSSSWKWMHQIQQLEGFSLKDPHVTTNCTLVHIFQAGFPPLKGIMTLETESYLLWNFTVEEWRHWLEGTDLHVLVWINHKNL